MLQVIQKEIKYSKVAFVPENKKLHCKVKMLCDCTGEVYDRFDHEYDFPVFVLPEDDVRLKLRDRPDRWRLYGADTKPLDMQELSPTGALKWVKKYPWVYSESFVDIGTDPDNGEIIKGTKGFWKQLTEEDIKKKKIINIVTKQEPPTPPKNIKPTGESDKPQKIVFDFKLNMKSWEVIEEIDATALRYGKTKDEIYNHNKKFRETIGKKNGGLSSKEVDEYKKLTKGWLEDAIK